MKPLEFTHMVEHVNRTRHLLLSKTLGDRPGDRQALNMVEITLGGDVYHQAWHLSGMLFALCFSEGFEEAGSLLP